MTALKYPRYEERPEPAVTDEVAANCREHTEGNKDNLRGRFAFVDKDPVSGRAYPAGNLGGGLSCW